MAQSGADFNTDARSRYDHLYKIVIVGDSGTGKTSLVNRIMKNHFIFGTIATIGADFFNRLFLVDGKLCNLQIWDSAGQEQFKSLSNTFYRDANAFIITYDVTREETFKNIQNWLWELQKHAPDNTKIIFLVGTQFDKVKGDVKQAVTTQQAEEYAKQNGFIFANETSACTGEDVTKLFQDVAKQIYINDTKSNENISVVVVPLGKNAREFQAEHASGAQTQAGFWRSLWQNNRGKIIGAGVYLLLTGIAIATLPPLGLLLVAIGFIAGFTYGTLTCFYGSRRADSEVADLFSCYSKTDASEAGSLPTNSSALDMAKRGVLPELSGGSVSSSDEQAELEEADQADELPVHLLAAAPVQQADGNAMGMTGKR